MEDDAGIPGGNSTQPGASGFGKLDSNPKSDEHNWTSWLNYLILTTVLLVVTTYITGAIAFNIGKNSKKTRRIAADKKARSYGTYMRVTSLCLALTILLHLADGIVEEVVVIFIAPELCAFSKFIKASTGSLAFIFSYTVMWFRQRSIYANPAMKHLTSHCTRALSIIVVVLLVLAPVVNTIVYVTCFQFEVVPSGCAVVGSIINPLTPWIVVGLTSLIMQILLLGLFLLPLRKHQSTMNGSGGKKAKRLRPIIRRAFITSLICAVTDTVTSFLAASSVINDGMTIGISMQVSTFCNLIMVILSFPDWRSTMFPCFCGKKGTPGRPSGGSSTNDLQDESGRRETSMT